MFSEFFDVNGVNGLLRVVVTRRVNLVELLINVSTVFGEFEFLLHGL